MRGQVYNCSYSCFKNMSVVIHVDDLTDLIGISLEGDPEYVDCLHAKIYMCFKD